MSAEAIVIALGRRHHDILDIRRNLDALFAERLIDRTEIDTVSSGSALVYRAK